MILAELAAIAQRFTPLEVAGELQAAKPLGEGNINTSWQLRAKDGAHWVLQRLNAGVFSDPEAIMNNALLSTAHLKMKEFPHEFPHFATADTVHWVWEAGSMWRLYPFLTGVVHPTPKPAAAHQAASAFGRLAADLIDLSPTKLGVTLPGFHDLEHRLAELGAAANIDACGRLQKAETTVSALLKHRDLVLLPQRETLPLRVVHGDAKIANLLFATKDDAAPVAAILDLDTLMAGYLFYDFGDLMRSCCLRAPGDDDADFNLDDDMLEALVQGYLVGLQGRLDSAERASLSWAAAYVSCTLAVRFATDYLAGDVYFRTQYEGQNLNRAKAQLGCLKGYVAAHDRIMRKLSI